MNAKRCDRCGVYYTINDLPQDIPVINPQYRAGCDLDLCTECIESFYEWMYTDYYFTVQTKKGRGTPDCIQRKWRECELDKKLESDV